MIITIVVVRMMVIIIMAMIMEVGCDIFDGIIMYVGNSRIIIINNII